MRTRGSESFIVLPLLPIFLIGLFPMLLLSLLGLHRLLQKELVCVSPLHLLLHLLLRLLEQKKIDHFLLFLYLLHQ